ncbi:rhodanese-like domain-containing protein [Brevibacillus nitrificans]|uniref:rhodanese-like domain-containing protein n=1 Tax=Brevibacillus nitrificans TaxID=651560 RepID=UPI00399CBCC7
MIRLNKPTINKHEFEQLQHENAKLIILDVRDVEKYQSGSLHVPGIATKNVPYIHMKEQDQALPEETAQACADATIITLCTSGNKAQKAAALLREKGYRASALEGGLTAWHADGMQSE